MRVPLKNFVPFLVAFLAFNIFLSACGGNSLNDQTTGIPASAGMTEELPINLQVDNSANEIPASAGMIERQDAKTPARQNDQNSYWHNLLNSRSYSGYIAVMFKEDTGVRLRQAEEIIENIIPPNPPLEKGGRRGFDLSQIRRGISSFTEEEIELAISNASRAGVKLTDWNLFYTIEERDPDRAEALIEELEKNAVVEFVHPAPNPVLTGGETTADISGEQDYLNSYETHAGLNVISAWENGAKGKNVVVADTETNWNFTHEDLAIKEDDIIGEADYFIDETLLNSTAAIQHGTAVVGILGAKHNGIGINGIVPDAKIKMFQVGPNISFPFEQLVASTLKTWLNESGKEDSMKPGDVIIIETGFPHPSFLSPGTSCMALSPTGNEEECITVPEESYDDHFTAIKNAVASGYIVVEAAANGALDLSSPEAQLPNGPDLSKESTGAIMVGASNGPDMIKADFSNCGKRVDVFAWGGQVVTTGGNGDHPASDPSDINKKYTNSFGGTSSATALVGGVAAAVQSYVKKVFDHDGIYLTPKQMKDLLFASGHPAVDDAGCNIGFQPDAGKAIELINNWQIPNTEKLDVHPVSTSVVSGIRYDMDGDSRAELISFGKDGKWYIDLSGQNPKSQIPNPNGDGYGEWDLILEAGSTKQEAGMIFPVVHDYNSDGRADLALYDSINGKWYIKYTTASVILSASEGSSEALTWDSVIDYTTSPLWQKYSRPVPGDYNGDHWLDIALQTPNGHWLIDYGGFDGVQIIPSPPVGEGQGEGAVSVQYLDHFGTFDKDVAYLTDEQLAQAPGWAWLGVITSGTYPDIITKSPDGISDGNIITELGGPTFVNPDYNLIYPFPLVFADNSSYMLNGVFAEGSLSFKDNSGVWQICESGCMLEGEYVSPEIPTPNGIFGDINCRPIPADYDGDGKDDRAVQCGTLWKIAYSKDTTGNFREVELGQALDPLPAFVYPGGIKYQDTVALYNYYKNQINCPPEKSGTCTIFDAPPPIGPYFAQCIKFWAPNASYCWDK